LADTEWRLVIVCWAYLFVIAGIWFTVSPGVCAISFIGRPRTKSACAWERHPAGLRVVCRSPRSHRFPGGLSLRSIHRNFRKASGFHARQILVIRGGAIGDFILTLPALAALRAQFPRAHLEVLGYPHIAQLALAGGLAERVQSIESRALAGFFARNGELAEDLTDYFSELI